MSKVSLDKVKGAAEGGHPLVNGDIFTAEESKQEGAIGQEGAGEGNFIGNIGNVFSNLGLSKKKTPIAATSNKRQAYYDNDETEALDSGNFDVPDDDDVNTQRGSTVSRSNNLHTFQEPSLAQPPGPDEGRTGSIFAFLCGC